MGIKLNHIPNINESRDYTLDMAINTIVLRKPSHSDKRIKALRPEMIHRYIGGYVRNKRLPCKVCGRNLETKYHD